MKYYIFCIGLLASSLTYAQERCGSMQVRENNISQNPELLENIEKQELQTRKFTQQNQILRTSADGPVIPVVVHVLYNTDNQNITDDIIQSQINVLNHDFTASNADISKVTAEFQFVIGNPNIRFALALRDPEGFVTSGIVRKQTSKTSFSQSLEDAKYSNRGGDDAWPSGSYLNIWVVPKITSNVGTVFGYSTFPGAAPAAEDGVVIAYEYFGLNTISADYNLGRTTTHEVGHWFNLYHTFQDGCVGTTSSTCDSRGDMVCDTPPAKLSNYDCTLKNTCTESPDEHNDMVMNFMNYANDACLNMFSAGQATRMLAALNGPRASLLISKGLTPPIVSALNASLTKITGLNSPICTNSVTPSITIFNRGNTTTITSISYTYKIDNGSAQALSWNGSLAINSFKTIKMPTVSGLSEGNHTYEVNIVQVNGQTDGNQEDDYMTKSFTIPKVLNVPYTESFEHSGQLPSGWTINNSDNSYTWETSDAGASEGTYALRVNNYEYGGNGQTDDLLPPLILVGSDAVLKFDVAYKLQTEVTAEPNYSDTLTVLASSDCGLSYGVLYKESGKDLTTGDPYFTTDLFVPAANEWKTKTINLSNFAGKNVQIVFRNSNDYENALYLDNIRFEGTPILGLNDQTVTTDQISLFPNPTKGSFTVSTTKNIESIVIYDLFGGEVKRFNSTASSSQTIDLSTEPLGVYMVKTNAGGFIKITKVIVE